MFPNRNRPTPQTAAALVIGILVGACEPTLVAGTYAQRGTGGGGSVSEGGSAPGPGGVAGGGGTAGVANACSAPPGFDPVAEGAPIEVPWSTGFEDGVCDYTETGGFCYADPDASLEIVEAPVHGGRYAAAFSVTADPSRVGWNARCVRQGVLPVEATYGVWFYIPSTAEVTSNWNLIHFRGGAADDWHGLWDVSLGTASDGSLHLYLFDFMSHTIRAPDAPPSVPIGSWFHVEFRLLRSSDATGEVALYQDGTLLLEVTGIVTADVDIGQWYVGNLVEELTPQDSTIYVDDVTIRTP
jgi:hypothetical protein